MSNDPQASDTSEEEEEEDPLIPAFMEVIEEHDAMAAAARLRQMKTMSKQHAMQVLVYAILDETEPMVRTVPGLPTAGSVAGAVANAPRFAVLRGGRHSSSRSAQSTSRRTWAKGRSSNSCCWRLWKTSSHRRRRSSWARWATT